MMLNTLSDYPAFAQKLIDTGARKFAFYGPVGAGKTTLVKELCKLLGVKDDTTSPTFSLINEYQGYLGPVRHADLYRLQDEGEALAIGIEDYLFDSNYFFIEWPEIVEHLLPEGTVRIKLDYDELSDVRRVELDA